MIKLNIQLMGGNGNSSPSGKLKMRTGGIKENEIIGESNLLIDTSLDNQSREQISKTLKDFQAEYGLGYNNTRIAELKEGSSALAYYDGDGIAINKAYIKSSEMQKAMEDCELLGYHPPLGSKSGLEAVTSHELGHAVTDLVGAKFGNSHLSIDKTSKRIVEEASALTRHKGNTLGFASKISSYATTSNIECIAEAMADCYCNGTKARSESKAIKRVIDKYLK